MNLYVELTREFNQGRVRAILSSGQAVVLHRLAIMSKDGDWIIREDEECLSHILRVLERKLAHYRFGAPLDARWLTNGWSAHFEFRTGSYRARTDFVSRPPRISRECLEAMWREAENSELPFVGKADLIALKQTNREKDYAVIGELAQGFERPEEVLQYSRSARQILEIASKNPSLAEKILSERGISPESLNCRDALESALDAERRRLMRINETRLETYLSAGSAWQSKWKELQKELSFLPLRRAHERMVPEAEKLLPFAPAPAEEKP